MSLPAISGMRQDVSGVRRISIIRTGLTCLGLALAVMAIYGQTGWFQFVNFDDDVHVYENRHVTTGLTAQNLQWDFGIHGPSQWHPLAWISHQLDCTWFGLQAGSHHLTSVALHLVSAILLYLTLQRLTGSWGIAAFVATAFAVHPLNVETVAWVSERRNVLCAVFCALTLWAYISYSRRGGAWRYCLVLIWHVAALMSKPLAVTMPCVLLSLDFGPLRDDRIRLPQSEMRTRITWLILEKLPLLALSAIASMLTIQCQTAVGTVATFDAIPFPMRLVNAVAAYGWYLEKLVWPTGLAVFYPHPALVAPDPWPRLILPATVSAIVLLLVTAMVLVWRKAHTCLLTGWLWFLGMLVPMIGIMQVGEQQQADRYAYLPMIGLLLMLASAGATLAKNSSVLRKVVPLSALIALGLWAMMAWQQASVWRNSVTLFSQAVSVTTRNHWAHNNLGMALLKQGRVVEAARQFQLAIEAVPGYALAHYNLGVALHELGQRQPAYQQLETALQLNPGLALAHQRLAALLAESGDLAGAVSHFREAAQLQPDDGQAAFNLGLALLKSGQNTDALHWLELASSLQPEDPSTAQALAMALNANGQKTEAITSLREFLQLHPDATEISELLSQLEKQP